MSAFVVALSDSDATLERVGGKGMSLAKLTHAGLPVPGGFHVTTEAYKRFVAENGIQPRILEALKGIDAANPAAVEPVSVFIGGLFAKGRIPTEITGAVSAAYAALPSTVDSGRSAAVSGVVPAEGRLPIPASRRCPSTTASSMRLTAAARCMASRIRSARCARSGAPLVILTFLDRGQPFVRMRQQAEARNDKLLKLHMLDVPELEQALAQAGFEGFESQVYGEVIIFRARKGN